MLESLGFILGLSPGCAMAASEAPVVKVRWVFLLHLMQLLLPWMSIKADTQCPNSMSPARLKGSVCCYQLRSKSSNKGSSEHNRLTLSALNLRKTAGCLLLSKHSKHF